MAKRPSQEQKFLTKTGLEVRWSCSHMTIERLIKSDPDFPLPTRFGDGAHRRWPIEEIEAYERSKVVARSA